MNDIALGAYILITVGLFVGIWHEFNKVNKAKEQFMRRIESLDINDFDFPKDRPPELIDVAKVLIQAWETMQEPPKVQKPVDIEKEFEEQWLRELEEARK